MLVEKKSTLISALAVFAAFNVVCDSFMVPFLPYSGVWYSWIFISAPITGILLGPWFGFLACLLGVMIGHSILFIGAEELLFTLGAPIGAMISAFLYRKKWKIPLIYYLVLIVAFLSTPIVWQLPLWGIWGMWDVYLALGLLLVMIVAIEKREKLWNMNSRFHVTFVLALSIFIGLQADVLFRIFIFVPCQTYHLFYGYEVGALQAIWALGAIETPIKATLSTIINVIIGPPIIYVAQKMGLVL